jgi:hypothetical protein
MSKRATFLDRQYQPGRDNQDWEVDLNSRDYLAGCQKGAQSLAQEIYRECFGAQSELQSMKPRDLIPLIKLAMQIGGGGGQ